MQILFALVSAVTLFHQLLRNIGRNVKVDHGVGARESELIVLKIRLSRYERVALSVAYVLVDARCHILSNGKGAVVFQACL